VGKVLVKELIVFKLYFTLCLAFSTTTLLVVVAAGARGFPPHYRGNTVSLPISLLN
jgi:hypothetical protein